MIQKLLLSALIGFGTVHLGGCSSSVCGNGICQEGENSAGCSLDCCSDIYALHESGCVAAGWNKLIVDVEGLPRRLLWKAPSGSSWTRGAMVTIHGGGGAASNFCYYPETNAQVSFSTLALENGFAVFSLDSTYGIVVDPDGRSVGKRWDSLAHADATPNVDLPFVEAVVSTTIPGLRPAGSSESIFLTGISNGAFMAVLAATDLGDAVTAFAPVSGGDPYGTYYDMGTHPAIERACAPGVFRDLETGGSIDGVDSCTSSSYPNELEWATPAVKPPFKQFYDEDDGAIDLSCKSKLEDLLAAHTYVGEAALVIGTDGTRTTGEHLWQTPYNQPIIDFFLAHAN